MREVEYPWRLWIQQEGNWQIQGHYRTRKEIELARAQLPGRLTKAEYLGQYVSVEESGRRIYER